MKILYTTDAHATERQPKIRTDNLLDSFFKKLDFIDDFIYDNNNIEFWLDGGDLFDKSIVNTRLVNRIIKRFSEFKRQNIFPIHGLYGNHLIKGNVKLSIEQSPLYTLQEAGYIKILPDPYIGVYSNSRILMQHHAIVEKPVIWEHTTYKQIADTNSCDYCLCSHIHTPQPITTVGCTTFVSPGSLTRGTGTENNLHREPQFAIIDLDKGEVEYVTCCNEVHYPFINKEECLSTDDATNVLVENISKTLEEYEKKSTDFYSLNTSLYKDGVYDENSKKYLDYVYNEVKNG